MVKASSFEVAQKKTRTPSAIEQELTTAKRESDEAEAAQDALAGEREAMLIDASDEQVLALEKKIDIQRLRMERAEKRIGLLTDELETVSRDENNAVLVARADELRKGYNHGATLKRLKEIKAAEAAILAEIHQANQEALAINPHLPDGYEPIPIVDVTITHLPGHISLIRYLTSLFPIIGFDQPVTVRWPAAYPEPVQAALAKLEQQKRAADTSARGAAPRGRGNTPEPGAWAPPISHALPPRVSERVSPDPAPVFHSGKR